MKFSELKIGMCFEMRKSFSSEEVMLFSKLSLDFNPIHLDEECAKQNNFEHRIVHGLLSSSLISAIIGTKMPGEGSIYRTQSLRFLKPLYIDQIMTARVTVTGLIPEKHRVILSTVCSDDEGNVIIDGEATVKLL